MNDSDQHTDVNTPSPDDSSTVRDPELDFLGPLVLLISRRWFVVGIVFLVSVIAAGVSLVIPLQYTATTRVLASDESGGGGGLGALLGDNPLASFALGSVGSSPVELYVEILTSSTALNAVIDDLDLMTLWEADKKQLARAKLSGKIQASVSDAGLITVHVDAETPELAADIANLLIEKLDDINKVKNISKGTSTRIFIERRLVQSKHDLKKAEERMLAFQNRYRTVAIEEQTRAAIEAAAELKALLTAKEIERNVLRRSLDSAHPRVQELQVQIDEIDRQLRDMDQGDFDLSMPLDSTTVMSADTGSNDLYPPISAIPTLAMEYIRHYRDVKVQNAIFELVTQQYETAKIQEARDTPTIHVLDEAVPPEIKSWPKRTYIVIAAAMLAFIFCLFYIFTMEHIRKLRQSDFEGAQVESILRYLKKDLSRIAFWRQQP